eukprot:COSAG01_NODE_7804_length_3050_cov_174.883090_3_plen_135_part_00
MPPSSVSSYLTHALGISGAKNQGEGITASHTRTKDKAGSAVCERVWVGRGQLRKNVRNVDGGGVRDVQRRDNLAVGGARMQQHGGGRAVRARRWCGAASVPGLGAAHCCWRWRSRCLRGAADAHRTHGPRRRKF